MRRILLLVMLVYAAPLWAQVPDTSRLPTGVRLGMLYQTLKRPGLAVRPITASAELNVVAEQVDAIVRRDLDYSDRFEMAATPPQLATGPVDYAPWNGLGVVYLVTGSVEPLGEGYLLRLQLHDVVYSRVRQNQAFALPALASADFRMAVHAAADEVVRWATGQRGMAASRIVFVRRGEGRNELVAVDSDGENVRTLASATGGLYSPTWSPDARRVAYTLGTAEGAWLLQERELQSGQVRTLTNAGETAMTPAYSPDGRRLAFAVWTGARMDLFEYDVAQRCCRKPIQSGRGQDISPSYSPDGRQLAFMSDRVGQPHIYVMPAGGGEAVLLSPYVYGEPGYYTSPAWSPESSLVAFHGRSRGQFQIMVADASRPGAEVRQITDEGSSEDPSWAPDGRHIVFVGVRGGAPGLYVMDTVSGRTRPLLMGGRARLPDWSPTLIHASALSVRGQ